MSDDNKDTKVEPTTSEMVEKMQEVFEGKIEDFDKFLSASMDQDKLQEFAEGYLQLRESGFDFDDAVNTAAEQIDLEVEDDEEEDE